jgi:hypothetical protein
MMKKALYVLYDVNFHHLEDGSFSRYSVDPVYVERESILPGCKAVTITARDSEGNRFDTSPGRYYKTEQEAWDWVKQDAEKTVKDIELRIQQLQKDLEYARNLVRDLSSTSQGD